MYRIVACDLDETLLQLDDKKVSQINRKVVAKARDLGVKFVLCTGRPHTSVQGTLDELGLKDAEDEYVISFNGGAITENKGNRMIYYQGITYEEAVGLFEKAKDYDVGIHVYTKENLYVWNFDAFGERAFQAGRQTCIERDDTTLDFLKGQEDIVKMLYVNTDEAYLHQIKEDLAYMTGDMDVSFSSNRFIEFNRKGVNKGEGLRRLAEYLGVDIADTIAIGDNFNDLAMIEAAGLGVGVANSTAGIIPYCDFITEADCDHGAVAEVIERFILS